MGGQAGFGAKNKCKKSHQVSVPFRSQLAILDSRPTVTQVLMHADPPGVSHNPGQNDVKVRRSLDKMAAAALGGMGHLSLESRQHAFSRRTTHRIYDELFIRKFPFVYVN
jgi:hypothetical protein